MLDLDDHLALPPLGLLHIEGADKLLQSRPVPGLDDQLVESRLVHPRDGGPARQVGERVTGGDVLQGEVQTGQVPVEAGQEEAD